MRLVTSKIMYLERTEIVIVRKERFTLAKPCVTFTISTVTVESGAHEEGRETSKEIAIRMRVTRAKYLLRK